MGFNYGYEKKKFDSRWKRLLLFVDGYRQIDVARLWHCSRSAVAQRFKKIKKFLNNT